MSLPSDVAQLRVASAGASGGSDDARAGARNVGNAGGGIAGARDSGLGSGAAAGIAIAVIVVVAGGIAIVVARRQRRRRQFAWREGDYCSSSGAGSDAPATVADPDVESATAPRAASASAFGAVASPAEWQPPPQDTAQGGRGMGSVQNPLAAPVIASEVAGGKLDAEAAGNHNAAASGGPLVDNEQAMDDGIDQEVFELPTLPSGASAPGVSHRLAKQGSTTSARWP